MLHYIKIYISFFILIVYTNGLFAQSTFEFTNENQKCKIPFELISNLIIIPVKVNGVELSFLLDTGVKETILFNVSKVDSLTLNNTKIFKVKGANDIEITALKSEDNFLELEGLRSDNHTLYVAFSQNSNFSSYLGEEVHGILGYHFFKDFIVELSYVKELINVYKKGYKKNKWNRYHKVELLFSKGKPYITAMINNVPLKLLMDTGMSDSLWMFEEDKSSINKYGYYEDFLGMTISGEILGKRSKVNEFEFVGKTFSDVKIAYPNTDNILGKSDKLNGKTGSIGGELLRRFNFVLDYENKLMYMRKNKHANDPFYYNKSGIVIRQDIDAVEKNKNNPLIKSLKDANFISFIDLSYVLTPEFVIDHVRKGSPAELAGILKGDILLEINGTKSFKYSLKAINALFHDKDGKRIKFKLQRGEVVLEKDFFLKSPLIKTL